MKRLRVHLASLLLFALLCALCTYWFITLTHDATPPVAVLPLAPAPSLADSQRLLGGSGDRIASQQFHVVGIMSLGPGQGAAAIIASSDGVTHTLAAGQSFDRDTSVAEVRAESVILQHGKQRSELFLAKPAQANGYLR
jgi:general secretion pathway protein C